MRDFDPAEHAAPSQLGHTRNGYEQEGGTKLLATDCIMCGRALRTPESLERGVGPICAEKHEFFTMTGPMDPEALAAALATSPPPLRQVVEAKLGDDDKHAALSAAIHAAGAAWEQGTSDWGYYVGSTMEIATALGFDRTARALQHRCIEGWKFDEQGNRIGNARPQGIVVTEKNQTTWKIELPYLESKSVFFNTNAALKAAGAVSRKIGSGYNDWERTFPATERDWLLVVNALVPTLAGTLGVLPSGETFVVPANRLPVPEPESVQAPPGIGPERAVEQLPEPATKDVAALTAGDTVWMKGEPRIIAWIAGDRTRMIVVTPEQAAAAIAVEGPNFNGKRAGGVTVSMRDVSTTPVTPAEVAAVEVQTATPPRKIDRELPANLMEHQREGVLWLLQQGSGLLAFDMGLGKSCTALVAGEAPILVVCPKSLKENWVRETAMWRPDLTAARLEAGKEATHEAALTADVTVINYDILTKFSDQLARRKYRTLILDESHYIKTLQVSPPWKGKPLKLVGSARAKASWVLAQDIPHRYLLSGTPMDNKSPCEMFSQLNIVAPREFPAFYPFGMRYCDPQDVWTGKKNVKSFDGASNVRELHERISGKMMLRKTKDILNLPEKWRQTKYLSLDEDTAKEYARAARDLLRYILDSGGWEAMNRAKRAEAIVRLGVLRRLCGIGKVEGFIEEVIGHWEGSRRPLVIFAQHKEVQEAIFAALTELKLKVAAIFGHMSENERQENKDWFQHGRPVSAPMDQRDYADVIVCSLRIAREGLTLTRAQDAYFIERTWSPFHLLQAEDRTHRIGQKNKVTITYFDAPGTIDEKIGSMLTKKLATGNAVIEGIESSEEDIAAGVFGELIAQGEFRKNARGPASEPEPDWIDPE